MTIDTVRLMLIPLPPKLLRLWVQDMKALEQELSCRYLAEPMEGFFLDIVREQLEITEKDPDNYLWHSFWLLMRKSDRVIVGSAAFKDVPNSEGEVEIGYGLGAAFEHNGYMSEAVMAMCEWALNQEGIKAVIAETDLDGYASQRILGRCGFKELSRGETLWWRLPVKEESAAI